MKSPKPACLLIATILGLGAPFAAPADEVRFVVFGDSQLVRPAQFERMVHEANLLRPHFATNTGDMIVGYTDDEQRIRAEWRRYLKQIEPLTMPFYPVPGSHDVGTPQGHAIYAEIWGDDRYFYYYDHGKVRCIVVNTYHEETKDRLLPERRDWLRGVLDDYAEAHADDLDERSIFLFVHSPFWRYNPEQEDGYHDWRAVEEFLGDYPVRMVLAGNTDRHHEYMWENRNGIDHVVVTSTGNFPHENERAGYFHSFLHISAINGDVRTAVVRPGSILPLDTVRPDEREPAARHGLRGTTLRISEWTEGQPLDIQVSVPVENTLDDTRTMRLRWNIARDSGVTVQPADLMLDIEPGETARPRFTFTADTAPSRDETPTLTVSATSTMRSGVVSREWEARYRDEIARAEAGEDILATRIPLEADFTFEATHTLFVPPSLSARRLDGTITIDGRIDDQAWQQAELLTDFRHSGTDTPAPQRTEVRVLYDDDYLYLSAWMEEPNPADLKADAHGVIPLTWNDDDIEFFFDPTQAALDHTRIFENAEGTRFTGRPIGTPDRYRPMDYESAIHIGDDYWSIEMRVPWSDIHDAEPASPGDEWGFNIWRHRQQATPPRFYWAVDAYQQGQYGRLVFE